VTIDFADTKCLSFLDFVLDRPLLVHEIKLSDRSCVPFHGLPWLEAFLVVSTVNPSHDLVPLLFLLMIPDQRPLLATLRRNLWAALL